MLGFASVFVLDGLHLMPFLKLTASHTALLFFCWWFSLPKKKLEILNFEPPKKTEVDGSQMIFRISIGCDFLFGEPAVHFQGFFPRGLMGTPGSPDVSGWQERFLELFRRHDLDSDGQMGAPSGSEKEG